MKIKEAFLNLSINKILEIHKVMNKLSQKEKPKIDMTTKRLLRKQIIISMGANNTKRIMAQSNVHVTNINRLYLF